MADRTPVETKNLDSYSNAPLPWSRPHDLFASVIFLCGTTFLGTTRPGGRPHAAEMGAIRLDSGIPVTSEQGTCKSRQLAAKPAYTIAARCVICVKMNAFGAYLAPDTYVLSPACRHPICLKQLVFSYYLRPTSLWHNRDQSHYVAA